MLAAALEAEVDAYLAELAGERDEDGHARVTRNGHARPRAVQIVVGAVKIRAPPGERPARRPRDGQEGPVQVPGRPTVVTEVSEGHRGAAPLYLHGLSTGDFAPRSRLLRLSRRALSLGDHPAEHHLAG